MAQNDLDRAQQGRGGEAELQLEAAHEQGQAASGGGWTARRDIVKARQSKAKIAEAQAAKSQQLFDRKLLGKEELQQATEAVAAFTAEAKAEERKELAMRTEGTKEVEIAILRAKNDLDEKKLLVSKAQFGVDKCTVKAPAKGKVLRMLVAVGDALGSTPRQPAVQFAAADPKAKGWHYPLIIRARDRFQESRFGRVRTATSTSRSPPRSRTTRGQRNLDRQGGGASPTGTRTARSILMEPLQFNDVRTLEVIIKLDNDAPSDLKIGQRVRVTLR